MFRSRWVIAVTLGLTALPLASQERPIIESEPRQEESVTDRIESTSDQIPAPLDPTPALNGVESAIRDLIPPENKAEDARAQRDLQAQEDMAKWAYGMLIATVATVILTFAALVAIIRTLHHTRRAADYTGDMLAEAKKATDAALSARDTARDANEAFGNSAFMEQRPWVYLGINNFLRSNFVDHEAEPDVGGFSSSVSVTVVNTGKTPAHNAEVWIDAFDDEDISGALEISIMKTDEGKFYRKVGIIPPNSKMEFDFPIFRTFRDFPGWEDFSFQSKLFCSVRYGTDASKRENHDASTMQIFQLEVEDDGVRSISISPERLRPDGAKINARSAIGSMA